MATTRELEAYADALTKRMGREVRAVRCVFGHGYPRCGCPWKLVEVTPVTGGYTTLMFLGYTIPTALVALQGILFGLNYVPRKD